MFHKCSSYWYSSHNHWICILLKYNSSFFRHNFNSKLQMLILLFWNSTWWCWWWCVYLCFDWLKCHDLTWGIEQALICMSVTLVSYYSDLSCLHGIICYACQVMHNKTMLCKPPFSFADDLVILSESQSGLQSALNKLENYCHKWQLTANKNKSYDFSYW